MKPDQILNYKGVDHFISKDLREKVYYNVVVHLCNRVSETTYSKVRNKTNFFNEINGISILHVLQNSLEK